MTLKQVQARGQSAWHGDNTGRYYFGLLPTGEPRVRYKGSGKAVSEGEIHKVPTEGWWWDGRTRRPRQRIERGVR